jgi:GntP family gluconate:H+ symporter
MSPFYVAFLLVTSITAIIVFSSKLKFNTFFVLLIVAAIVGLAAGLDGEALIKVLKKGFGNTLEKIGLLIIFGTTLGILLEKTGATLSLAQYIIAKTGEKRMPLAVVIMGFIIGLPIFCDSGFVVLIGLVMSLSARIPKWHVFLVGCLASALLAVHCLVPPHPGITAAAGILKVDIGQAILLGGIIAIPPTIVGYFYSKKLNNRLNLSFPTDFLLEKTGVFILPSPLLSFLPIVVPILLISLKSIFSINPTLTHPSVYTLVAFVGEPMIALFVGILMTLPLLKNITRSQLNDVLDSAIDKSGSILAVTAAGGAFGEVIQALELGKVFGEQFAASGLGLFIPFALAVIFKTAQGSSTVAVISTASIVAPLLPSLGMDTEGGQLFALMAAGAGSMVFSHTNDSYFWVISKFSKLDTATTLKLQSTMTALMGITTFLTILGLSYFWH